MNSDPRIIVAIDRPDLQSALQLARTLPPSQCRLKVGKELFTAAGPAVVDAFHSLGFQVFLDLKFHDIPNTVAGACRVAAEMGVWMVNVHASGGQAMMQAALEAIDKASHRPLLIAVTLLTSMDDLALRQLGLEGTPEEWVLRWGRLAIEQSKLDGLVCSAQEVPLLRRELGQSPCLVTPGIRPQNSQHGDQRRVMTPARALETGSSYLVIGRPVTAAQDPAAALSAIVESISA